MDTAGRLAVDEEMMAEIAQLHTSVNPIETLFVVDAMTGQDAANTAKAFGETLPLTGVILTKVDADTRGGAALSVRSITGKPIKFLGVGEKIAALDPFHPDRLASRILGMGDVMSLIEEAEQKVDKEKAAKLARKVKKGQRFDLEDFRDQLQQMNNMGGITGMLDKMPGMGNMAQMAQQKPGCENVCPYGGDDQLYDPRRTASSGDDSGVSQAPYHQRFWYPGARPQPPAEAA